MMQASVDQQLWTTV